MFFKYKIFREFMISYCDIPMTRLMKHISLAHILLHE